MHKSISHTALCCSVCPIFWLIGLACMDCPAYAQAAQPAAPRTPLEKLLAERLLGPRNERPLAERLRSPRETVKTLYFAITLYDVFPQLMDEATSCLDLDGLQPRPTLEDSAMLALDLEYVCSL